MVSVKVLMRCVKVQVIIFRSALESLLVLFNKMEPTVGLGLAAAAGGTFAVYKVDILDLVTS